MVSRASQRHDFKTKRKEMNMWRPPTGWEVWLTNGAGYFYFKDRNACIEFLRRVESVDPSAADRAECEEKELYGWKDGVDEWLAPNVAFERWQRGRV